MTSNRFNIRNMARNEVGDFAIEWAAREGWNPGFHDADCFFATDPNSFFVGILDGEPIGCISTVAYDETFGFLGFYIVKPEYRGQGFGFQIWKKGMAYLGNRNVGLDGVVRVCRKGFKIGPLFANDKMIAENLFQSLTSQIKNQPVYLDIPEINPEAQELVKKWDMKMVFETARMYTKNKPNLPIHQIFGVTTFEVG